jgi:hypothetical protein
MSRRQTGGNLISRTAPLESDAIKANATLDDALKGLEAADAALAGHSRNGARRAAINLPSEEALVGETVRLLERWKSQAATLLTELDAGTSALAQDFEGLFDETVGRTSAWDFKRKIHQANSSPASISSELEKHLAAGALLDSMLKTMRPVLLKHYRDCEGHLLRIIEQRQRIDFDIEDIQRRSDVIMLHIADRRSAMASRVSADRPALLEEYRALVADREALRVRELEFKPERETLQRLISIYVDFVDELNAHVGVVNAMARKLSVDNERRIALLKAVQTQLSGPPGQPRASVSALMDAFDANVLAGHDLAERKAVADQAFARRLQARLSSDNAQEEAEPITEPQSET